MLGKFSDIFNPPDFGQLWEEINRRNYNSLRLLSIVGILLAILNIFAQSGGKGNESEMLSYYMLLYFLALYFFQQFFIGQNNRYITVILYLVEIPPLIMAMLMGTVLDPSHYALTFLLFLTAMPLFILDVPWRVILGVTVWTVVFIVMVFLFKEENTWRPDMIHVLEFYMVSVSIASVVLVSRIDEVRAYMKMQQVFEEDELTGLSSKDHFFAECKKVVETRIDRRRKTCIAFLDVRAMKVFNEKYGWEEGDRLLKAIADSLRVHFPGRMSSRISDDHFALMAYQDELDSSLKMVNSDLTNYLQSVVDPGFNDRSRIPVLAGIV